MDIAPSGVLIALVLVLSTASLSRRFGLDAVGKSHVGFVDFSVAQHCLIVDAEHLSFVASRHHSRFTNQAGRSTLLLGSLRTGVLPHRIDPDGHKHLVHSDSSSNRDFSDNGLRGKYAGFRAKPRVARDYLVHYRNFATSDRTFATRLH